MKEEGKARTGEGLLTYRHGFIKQSSAAPLRSRSWGDPFEGDWEGTMDSEVLVSPRP